MFRPTTFLFTYFCCLTFLAAQGPACRNEARIDLVQSQYSLSGQGVLTVMMDRGIDYRHPDFIDAAGNTRIAYIFDLYDDTGANDADNPYGVGTIYDRSEINAALQSGSSSIPTDIFGHGTATTGIMSGNGTGIDDAERFRGVAHQAEIISIIVTKDGVPAFGNYPGRGGAFNPGLLPVAFQFAEDKINELGLPSITLLNIGSIQNPTDGSTGFCDVVEDFVAQGHTFVCGVGDDGGKDNHMIASLMEGQTTEIQIQKGEAGNLRLSGWYSEEDRISVRIERPDGTIEGPFASPSGPGLGSSEFLDQINLYHRGANVEFANSDANLRQLLIDISAQTGTYKILLDATRVQSDGTFNAFLNPSRFNNDNAFLNNNNPGGNIHEFSACPSVISPGDYVATNTYVDINGVNRMRTGEGAPGELWKGSSVGPTMDGRLGIDLAAPGELAAAAYSPDSYYANFSFNILQGSEGEYGLQTAVSASAPLTAGVIALMLEVNPNLTPAEIKLILQETSRMDSFTETTPNPSWGYGKLDALAAVERVLQIVNTKAVLDGSDQVILQPNPAHDMVQVHFSDLSLQSVPLTLYSIDGRAIWKRNAASGAAISLSDLAPGIYLLRGQAESMAFAKKLIKR